MKSILRTVGITIFIISQFIFFGCATSSNFYSARTLEEGKLAVTAGADDIVTKSASEDITVSMDGPFAFSLGLAYGLPLRLETGIRWYVPQIAELYLREQVNPRTFDIFDFSLNFTYGNNFGNYSYVKYGAGISKNINEFEPFFHYTFYKFFNVSDDGFEDIFSSGAINEFIDQNRSIGFGIGVPVGKIKFFPEVDYQYYNGSFSEGLWHFGIGLRIYTN